jgi:poly(A) polymerase
MELLGLKPGPVVGRAYKFLLEERMEHGPLDPAEAEAKLHEWWAAQPESAAALSTEEP